MKYENEILLILREADPQKGLPLSSIVRNVYNMTSCDLFNARSFEDVRKDVAKFLRSESQLRGGSVVKGDKKGLYRLNSNSQKVRQMLLSFEVGEDEQWML